MKERICIFLARYRITPQTTTGLSPAELLMGRRLRTHLDLLHPDVAQRVERKQQKELGKKAPRRFHVGDKLFAKNFQSSNWIPVTVSKVLGPLSYQVTTSEGIVLRRHVDHLRVRHCDHSEDKELETSDDWTMAPSESKSLPTPVPSAKTSTSQDPQSPPHHSVPVRHSTRTRTPIDHYSPGSFT